MKRFKRCLTFFLVLSMLLGSMPVNASTADMLNSEVELNSIENLQENLTSEDDSVVDILLSDSLIQLEVGDTYTLTYALLPDDTDIFDVEWLSSDVEIAVVDNGLVTAVAEGEVEIIAQSAEDESIAAVCVVEVVTKDETGLTQVAIDANKTMMSSAITSNTITIRVYYDVNLQEWLPVVTMPPVPGWWCEAFNHGIYRHPGVKFSSGIKMEDIQLDLPIGWTWSILATGGGGPGGGGTYNPEPLPLRVVLHPPTITTTFCLKSVDNKKININTYWTDEYFARSARIPNNNLAIASLLLSEAAYRESDVKNTLSAFGFDNFESYYEFSDNEIDRVAHIFASKRVVIGGRTCNIVAVVCRGTRGNQEWMSNVKNAYSGFTEAALKVSSNLGSYLKTLEPADDLKYLITGHSRGAAVSNIIGWFLTDDFNQNNVYAYCFAPPNVIDKNNQSSNMNNIINLMNKDDYIICSWPPFYYKHGCSIEFNPSSTPGILSSFKALTNISYNKYKHYHYPETYLSCLLQNRELLTTSQRNGVRVVIIRCPVDVEIYDNSGDLVWRVVGGEIDSTITGVAGWLEGDEKYCLLSPDEEYIFKMTGADDGVMNYSISDANPDNWEILEEKAFQNVSLFSGKQMTSNVSSTADISDARLFITDNNVIVSEVMEDGTEKAAFTITAIAGAGGKVSGGDIYAIDDLVTLTATPNTNYTFDGWYDNGTRISSADSTYSFTAMANRTLEARFKHVPKGNGGGGGGISTSTYAATFETNGGSAIAKETVNKDDKLTKPGDPTKDGFIFAGWFTDKELTKEYDFATLVTDNFTLYAKWTKEDKVMPEPVWTNPFTDVKPSDWFYDPVEYAITNGLFYGTSDTIFAPNDTMTRAMLVTVLWRSAGSPVAGETPFTDVKAEQWYSDAVTWAAQNNIVSGIGNGLFAPNAEITREQMAVMLYNYSKHIDVKLPQKRSGTFMDETLISPWAKEAVAAMYAAEIINGKDQNNFDPQGDATRAEVATMMRNFLEIIGS